MSSGSESDEEYVPGVPEQVSEEDSADEETDLQFEKELEHKTKKRKSDVATNGRSKKRTRNSCIKTNQEPETKEEKQPEEPGNPEDEKKREDDLWAMFLEGTDTKPKPAQKLENKANDQTKTSLDNIKEKSVADKNDKKSIDDSKDRERRIFEFAGETIVVENDVIKEKIKTSEKPATVDKDDGPSRSRASGGVAGILGQLNKKNKLSTLEKSKLDWMTYKKEEGIEEEIQSHNKGKAGYLDRKDFLERADIRQYEIERDLRMSRRSNR
ncbi:unnamed protein product [Chilo suppressalis]|uniref:Craniofacial development protein 1 n=1 Tax=Chilo suppressalis TaxID=168631 RepID=A0ABN8AZN7_CHISP|nr:hypothetical protein evm_007512 [Chilo suppressalis]CAH0398817.1 unnamed protein product [Chilo suppressalis]